MIGRDARVEQLTPLQRAALAIKGLRAELDALRAAQHEPIAVVGMACRIPGGVTTPDEYWEMLLSGKDAISEVPPDRWDVDAYFDPDLGPGTMNTRWGGFLDRVDQFDPGFFDLAVREAACMDPQQRLLLEVTWEALERAGIAADKVAGSRTGVFVGMCSLDYGGLHAIPPPRGNTGVSLSVAVNRISYLFDFTGPSFVVDTACSASLLSAHLACQSLRQRECDMAIAGGVNLILSPTTTVSFAQAGMMAPDGRCKTFDAAADGYVRGEGCGIVVLKRLSDALERRDPILSVILGSATNQDGRTNGLTAPRGGAQVDVIRAALRAARVEPGQIGYVETHGTGTKLGDAVEVAALTEAIGAGRNRQQTCLLSAVKTNIGHLESAAGIAGLLKVSLAIERGRIPPVVHFNTLNPAISFGDAPFAIPTEAAEWPTPRGKRFAGLSGFSFGGSNVHLVFGEAPPRQTAPATSQAAPCVIPLSAKTEWSLRQLAGRYADFLSPIPDLQLADVAYTAGDGRVHHPLRLAVVAASVHEAAAALRAYADGGDDRRVVRGCAPAKAPRVGFMFGDGDAADAQGALARVLTTWGIPVAWASGIGAGAAVCARLTGGVDGDGVAASEAAVRDLFRQRHCTHVLWFGCHPEGRFEGIVGLSSIDGEIEPQPRAHDVIAALFVRGATPNWAEIHRPHMPSRIALPTYPFQRRRCWLEPDEIRPPIGGRQP